jgi:hypothetical protein
MTQKKVPAIETLPLMPIFSEALTMYVFKALLHRWMHVEATTKDLWDMIISIFSNGSEVALRTYL